MHTEETASLALALATGQGVRVSFAGPGERVTPTEADMAAINAGSPSPLTADDVHVFQDYAVSDGPITQPIRFTRAALDRIAACYDEGRSVLRDHDSGLLSGRTFAADIVREAVRGGQEHDWVRVRWFALAANPDARRAQFVADCRAGILRECSVGVDGGLWDFVEAPGGTGDYYFVIDDSAEAPMRLDAVELSRVNMGACIGAGDVRGAALSRDDAGEAYASATAAASLAGRDFRPDPDTDAPTAAVPLSLIYL